MGLTLGCPRTNGSPTDEIGQILRRYKVKVLGSGGQPQSVQVEQQLPGQPEAFVNLKRIIKVRIVDQSLPANGGSGFFKINSHHQQQLIGQLCGQDPEPFTVFHGRVHVVNAAGADHHNQTVIIPR